MGRDAKGHGHNPGEPGNPYHGKHGQFSDGSGAGADETAHHAGEAAVQHALLDKTGHLSEGAKAAAEKAGKPHVTLDRAATRAAKQAAAKGDHQGAQTHSGSGYPVAPHRGAVSVGTHASAGGGGSGGGAGPRDGSIGKAKGMKSGPMKTTTGLRQAAQERVAIGEDIDARHMPLSDSAQAQRLASRRLRNIPAGR
jgi:hypothetical protein